MKWLVLLLLLLAVAGGAAAIYFWQHSDELLRTAMLDGLKKWAPETKAELGRCRVDLLGRVHLDDFSLTLPGETQPFVVLPETIVDLDRDAFLQRQEVVIQNVELTRPKVRLQRSAKGIWNFSQLPLPVSNKKSAIPECRIDKAEVLVELARDDALAKLQVSNVDLMLKPTSKRVCDVLVSASIEQIGRISCDGKLNVDVQTGSLKGSLSGLRINRKLVEYASAFEPQVGAKVALLEGKLRDHFMSPPRPTNPSPFELQGIALQDRKPPAIETASGTRPVNAPVNVPNSKPATTPSATLDTEANKAPFAHQIPIEALGAAGSILGLTADVNLQFQLDRLQADAPPRMQVNCDILRGDITNTGAAFPLTNLSGQLEVTPGRVQIKRLHASNGPTEVTVKGDVVIPTDAGMPQGRLFLKLNNILCDQRLRDRLSIGFGRIYDAHHPEGLLDMEAVLVTTPEGPLKAETFTVSANRCSVKHDLFPYLIEDAVGTIKQVGKDIVIDMRGYAGRQPITLKGQVKNPGPQASIVFDIEVANLPIDDAFINACPPGLQKTILAMQLKGLVDGKWRLEKPAGENQPFKPNLVGYLHDASMVYEPFPYRVDALSGQLDFDGTTWSFTNLKGLHGGAVLSANGVYVKPKGEPGRLELRVDTKDAPIDTSLYDAVPKSLKKIWQDFQPRGTIKHLVTRVEWDEGTPPIVRLPVIEITRSRGLIKNFPYELTDIEASYEYIPAHFSSELNRRLPTVLKIKSFEGRHNQALFIVNRNGGFVTIDDAGDWRVRLESWQARQLKTDQDLLRAVSPGLRSVLATFDPEHELEVSGLLELRGTADPKYPLTAAWSILTELAGGSVAAGLTFQEVHGRLKSRGTWDGTDAVVDGELELDSVKAFEKYELNEIRGPFKMRKGLLTFGADRALDGVVPDEVISPKDQITAKFLQGLLTINGQVAVDAPAAYHVRVALAKGELETFARRYMGEGEHLQGKIQAWLDLQGEGNDPRQLTGNGQLQISPAKLYQLPIIFHVLDVLIPTGTKAAAFQYAICNFQVSKGRFLFNSIDLVGDQVQMRGAGKATFEGDIDLMFYSMLPYSMLPKSPFPFWVPVVSEVSSLVNKATREVTKGWVVVKVTGKTSDPKTEIVPAANLDDAFKNFLNTLRPLPMTPQPLRPQTASRPDDRRR